MDIDDGTGYTDFAPQPIQSVPYALHAAGGVQERFHDLARPAAFDMRVRKVREKSRALIGEAMSDRLWNALNADGGPDIPALTKTLRGA